MSGRSGADRPLFFLHIAKAGGTSLSDAVGRLYAPERRFSDLGNVSLDFIDGLGAALLGRCFLFGHAGPGVAAHLTGTSDIITLLRRPAHQAVSNYLHVLSDPENALFGSARRQSFTAFLRENPHQIAYQAASLAVAISTPEAPVDPLNRSGVDEVLGFLESIAFVGVIERPDDCCAALSRFLAADPPLGLPCLNSATFRGVEPRVIARLHRDYETLSADPGLAYLFALEALVYAKAQSLLARRITGDPRAPLPAQSSAGARFWAANRFSAPAGPLTGATHVCALDGDAGHLIFGPHDRLKAGYYAVEFKVAVTGAEGPYRGSLEIEVLANAADSLARRWLRCGALLSARRRTLIFRNRRDTDVLEFRVRARGFGGGALEFGGVGVSVAAFHRAWPSHLSAFVRRMAVKARRAARGSIPAKAVALPAGKQRQGVSLSTPAPRTGILSPDEQSGSALCPCHAEPRCEARALSQPHLPRVGLRLARPILRRPRQATPATTFPSTGPI